MNAVVVSKLKLQVHLWGNHISISRRGDDSAGGEASVPILALARELAKCVDGFARNHQVSTQTLQMDLHDLLDPAIRDLQKATALLEQARASALGVIAARKEQTSK